MDTTNFPFGKYSNQYSSEKFVVKILMRFFTAKILSLAYKIISKNESSKLNYIYQLMKKLKAQIQEGFKFWVKVNFWTTSSYLVFFCLYGRVVGSLGKWIISTKDKVVAAQRRCTIHFVNPFSSGPNKKRILKSTI